MSPQPRAASAEEPAATGFEAVFDRVHRARIVPVVRETTSEAALGLVERLVHAGLEVIEITTTIPQWDTVIATARDRHPQLCLGAGTVTTAALARRASDAGAGFLVSPCLAAEARTAGEACGIPLIEGGYSPTEVLGAARHGVAKLFPAHVGGVGFLRSLLAVAPRARIMPTGGIPLTEVPHWLAAGAYAVGVGRDLTAPGDIAARVREVLAR